MDTIFETHFCLFVCFRSWSQKKKKKRKAKTGVKHSGERKILNLINRRTVLQGLSMTHYIRWLNSQADVWGTLGAIPGDCW